jgi:hypothetical protein
MLGNAAKSSWRTFEQYLKDIGDSLGNARRVLETFSAMLSEKQRHFGKWPTNSGDLTGILPTRFSVNRKQEDPLAYHLAGLHIF